MKETNFRIGNNFYSLIVKSDNIGNISTDIKIDTVKSISLVDDKYYYINDLGLMYTRPIGITEELLLKLGFIKTDNIGSYIKTPIGTKNGYGFKFHTQNPYNEDMFNSITECSYFEQQLYVTGGVKYIHQLQNLYYSLTGQELKLNL